MKSFMPAGCVVLGAGFIALPGVAQEQLWIRQFGANFIDMARAIAPDGLGGAFIGGRTDSSLAGPYAGLGDAWVARYDHFGTRLWIRQIGTSERDELEALAPDDSGGFFLAGSSAGNLPGPTAGASDVLLTRWDGAGNPVWMRQFGSAAWETATAMVADGASGVFIAGFTMGSLAAPHAGLTDAWFARYDGAGNRAWIHQLGTTVDDEARAVARDDEGGVFVCGGSKGSLGGPNVGSTDVWLARYGGGGNQVWIRQFGTSDLDNVRSLASDGAGGVFILGYTGGSLGAPNAGSLDVWLARFDAAGNQLWVRQFGSASLDWGFGLARDGAGGVFACGKSMGSVGGPHLGQDDAWLARYTGDGTRLWLRQFGTNKWDEAVALAPDSVGGVLAAGFTYGALAAPNAGSADVWIGRWSGTCYPDCNGDGVLNPADFGCFQTKFALGDPYADCNGDGALNLADFGCFMTRISRNCD